MGSEGKSRDHHNEADADGIFVNFPSFVGLDSSEVDRRLMCSL